MLWDPGSGRDRPGLSSGDRAGSGSRPMRVLTMACTMAVLLAAPNAASAAPPAADAVPAGRVGLLPQPWVEPPEAGNLREQSTAENAVGKEGASTWSSSWAECN